MYDQHWECISPRDQCDSMTPVTHHLFNNKNPPNLCNFEFWWPISCMSAVHAMPACQWPNCWKPFSHHTGSTQPTQYLYNYGNLVCNIYCVNICKRSKKYRSLLETLPVIETSAQYWTSTQEPVFIPSGVWPCDGAVHQNRVKPYKVYILVIIWHFH